MPGIRDIFPIKVYQDNYEQQFFDTIAILMARQEERHIEQLLAKAAEVPLTTEEKQQLRTLLSSRATPAADQ